MFFILIQLNQIQLNLQSNPLIKPFVCLVLLIMDHLFVLKYHQSVLRLLLVIVDQIVLYKTDYFLFMLVIEVMFLLFRKTALLLSRRFILFRDFYMYNVDNFDIFL